MASGTPTSEIVDEQFDIFGGLDDAFGCSSVFLLFGLSSIIGILLLLKLVTYFV